MQDPGGELPANSMLVPCNRPLAGRRVRSHPTQVLKCPRCDSLNTKFCYYNNYNLSQPRHFCKNCRRYWTKGGVLRNVPVGGGCRKNKRSKAPRNLEQRGSPRKCASNSTTVSSENSTVTVAVQEASSASNCGVKIPDGESFESFDQETLVQQILSMPDPLRLEDTVSCDAVAYGSGPENAIPRLLNGLASLDYGLLDWQIPAQSLTNLGNLLSDGTNSNSNPYGCLINSSSPAGLSFSDLQWMMQQQQPKMGRSLEEPCPEGRCINSNNNNAAASEWQPNYHSEVLYEMANDFCGWGMAGLGGSEQKPLRLP